MGYVLRLLDDITLGHQSPEWRQSIQMPGMTRVGYATWRDKLSIFDLKHQFKKVAELLVPPEPPIVAVHPACDRVATLSQSRLSLRDASGAEYAVFDVPTEWGTALAVGFTPDGAALCLTTVKGANRSRNTLHLLDTRSLGRLGQVALEGPEGDGHYLVWHPIQKIVVVEVACGQDGSWLNSVSVGEGKCTLLSGRMAVPGSFHLAGFEEDGKSCVGVGDSTIARSSFPDGNLLGLYDLAEGRFSQYLAGWFEDLLLVPTQDEDEGTPLLLTLDATTFKEVHRLGEAIEATAAEPLRHGIFIEASSHRMKVYQLERDGL